MVLPLLAALGIGAVASVVSGAMGASAANKASKVQQKTAAENKVLGERYKTESLGDLDSALAGALGEFDRGKEGLSPYASAGTAALSRLSDIYGLNGAEGTARGLSGFTESPGYQFRLSQGVQALDRSANARGGLYSGAAGKALTEYGQNMGANEWGNYVGGLSGLANYGMNAGNTLSNIAGSRANAILGTAGNAANVRQGALSAITNANSQGGAAQAGGIINQANAWNAGLNNLTQLAMFGSSKYAAGN